MPGTFEEFIQHQIREGYWSEKDLAPIKCENCKSVIFEDENHVYENLGCISFDRYCESCGEKMGAWEYGLWDTI